MRLGISLEPTSRVNVETRMTSGTLKLRLKHPIRILHLEKNPDHSNLVKLKLKAEGVPCVLRRIENRADFIAALEKTHFDLILAEYCLPRFDGLAALEIAREKCPDLSFIFVTDAYREESTELLYAGATDCVLKPTLSRLVPAILRALAEADARRRWKQAEKKLKALREIHQAMASPANFPDIVRKILDKVDISLPDAAANFVLFDTATGELEPIACRNIDETRWRSEYLSTDAATERAILQSKKSRRFQSTQVSTLALRRESYREQGLVSYLGVPVPVRKQVIGLLSVLTKQEQEFTDEEIEFIEMLAGQAGLAARDALLHRENHRVSEELAGSERQIRTLLTSLTNAQDEVARRIAHALHDESGQLLASVYITLDETARTMPASARPQFEKAKALLDQVENRLRDLSHELYPTTLEPLGLIPSLEFLAEQVSKRRVINIAIENNLEGRLSPSLELTLYRVIQEALNNTTRHAQAANAKIRLLKDLKSISCFVSDDGIGFDPKAVSQQTDAKSPTLGLIGMSQRVAALGGTLEINSAPARGTELRIEIPLE
jgi:signal transduction histidine kinase